MLSEIELSIVEKFPGEENMTIEKEEELKVRRCILVGIHIDTKSRELLSWTLNNVTQECDRVIAIYVSRTSGIRYQ